MTIIGIDPGLSGGLAYLHGNVIETRPMPLSDGRLDREALRAIITAAAVSASVVYLEVQQAMRKAGRLQGVASTGVTMYGFGLLEGLLLGAGCRYHLVRAQTWQSELLRGIPGDTKTAAGIAAKRLWPAHAFLATPRCKKPHAGMVDAALIAEWGRRRHVP